VYPLGHQGVTDVFTPPKNSWQQSPVSIHFISLFKGRMLPILLVQHQNLGLVFEIWKDASMAIFPAIPNLDSKANKSNQSRGGIRGKVTTLSAASRRNLMRYLATLAWHSNPSRIGLYNMDFPHLWWSSGMGMKHSSIPVTV